MMAYFCTDCNEVIYTAQERVERMYHSELDDGDMRVEEWHYLECPICGGSNVHTAGKCEACGEPMSPFKEFCPECEQIAVKRFLRGVETIIRQIRVDIGCSNVAARELLDLAVEKEGI